MLQRFYEMRKEVKVAMLQLDKDFNNSRKELDKIKEICDTLVPLDMAVQYLSKKIQISFCQKKSLSLLLRN